MKNIHLQLRNLIGQIESAMIQGNILTLYGNVPTFDPQSHFFYRCVPTFGFGRLATMIFYQRYCITQRTGII